MKALNLFSTSLLLLLCGSSVSCGQILLPDAKVTVRVLDENKQPIEGANASVGFEVISQRSFESKSEGHHGPTNADGLYTISNPTVGLIFYGARKTGYYDTTGPEYRFTSKEAGRWQPYNVGFDVVLKKIVNPVPMYARQRDVIELPKLDEPVGYDLIVSDWVAPLGKGIHSDFIFKGHVRYVDRKDHDIVVNLAFAEIGDGIQQVDAKQNEGSALRLDRTAPNSGYLSQIELNRHKAPGSSVVKSATEDTNYYFRIRTIMRDGKIISALYGKIHGPIRVDALGEKTCEILFTYYINPDGTPNLEFDPKRNLFTHLPSFEQPRDP